MQIFYIVDLLLVETKQKKQKKQLLYKRVCFDPVSNVYSQQWFYIELKGIYFRDVL